MPNRKVFLSLFSTRLKTLRGDAKQAEFARRIGLPQNSYSRYESGERVPDIDTLSQMASSLNVSSDWLLGLAGDRTSRRHRVKTPHANSTPPPIASLTRSLAELVVRLAPGRSVRKPVGRAAGRRPCEIPSA